MVLSLGGGGGYYEDARRVGEGLACEARKGFPLVSTLNKFSISLQHVSKS